MGGGGEGAVMVLEMGCCPSDIPDPVPIREHRTTGGTQLATASLLGGSLVSVKYQKNVFHQAVD